VFSSDLPGVNPTTLNGMIIYYRLMTKWSGLGDSTELSRMGLSHSCYKVKFLSFFFKGIYGSEKKKELIGKIESDLRRLFDCYVESAASGGATLGRGGAAAPAKSELSQVLPFFSGDISKLRRHLRDLDDAMAAAKLMSVQGRR
jgi:hypothetical protein